MAEIQQAKAKWLGEWQSVFTDDSVPTNGYRVVQELMKAVDLDRTIALHDAGGSRGYLSPFWPATRPRNYIGMGGMAAMGWSMGGAIGAKLGRPDHLVFHVLGDASFSRHGPLYVNWASQRVSHFGVQTTQLRGQHARFYLEVGGVPGLQCHLVTRIRFQHGRHVRMPTVMALCGFLLEALTAVNLDAFHAMAPTINSSRPAFQVFAWA